jgi:hypothetical protein
MAQEKQIEVEPKVQSQVNSVQEETAELYEKAIKSYKIGESTADTIRKIALNLEKICELYGQNEYKTDICNRMILHFRRLGHGHLEQTVYNALRGSEWSRFRHERFSSSQSHSINRDLPEDINIEIKQKYEAINALTNIDWSRYPNDTAQKINLAISEVKQKLEAFHEANNLIRLDKTYDPLEQNKRNSPYFPKKPLVQPPKDEQPNCITRQYEFLVKDIQLFVEDFLKHYFPPAEHQPYYAYAVKLTRKFFTQYASDKIHRDFSSWADILAADMKLNPKSGKSAKEVSARYGMKIRRYAKENGTPIFGRKGICKEQIQKKRPWLIEFLKDVYTLFPVFLLTSHLYSQTKEKIIVDHTIDMRDKRQWAG